MSKPTIRLRAVEPDDIDLLFDVENDTSLWHLGNTNVPYSKEWLRNYILSTTSDIFTDKQLHLVAELVASEDELKIGASQKPTIVGIVDLLDFNPRNSRAEVGIVILEGYRQHGYATSILEQIISYTRHFLHIHQLYAVIPEDNHASRQLFRHVGFMEIATLADWLITENGWKPAVVVQKML